jgi:hypothetical protein
MPAAAKQPQQQEDRYPTGQPDNHLGVTEQGHLRLQNVISRLTLRHGGLAGGQLVEAFVDRRRGPGGSGGVAHHDAEIWKINKSVNKIRIRIQFYQVQKQVTSIVVYLKPADWLDKTNGNLYIL